MHFCYNTFSENLRRSSYWFGVTITNFHKILRLLYSCFLLYWYLSWIMHHYSNYKEINKFKNTKLSAVDVYFFLCGQWKYRVALNLATLVSLLSYIFCTVKNCITSLTYILIRHDRQKIWQKAFTNHRKQFLPFGNKRGVTNFSCNLFLLKLKLY